jgi:hypothetical protein
LNESELKKRFLSYIDENKDNFSQPLQKLGLSEKYGTVVVELSDREKRPHAGERSWVSMKSTDPQDESGYADKKNRINKLKVASTAVAWAC